MPCDTGRVDTIMMNKHMGEKEKQTASCALERGRTEEAKVVRNRLMWVASLPPRTTVTSKPGLLPRAISVFVVLTQPWSVLIFTAHVPTKGHTDAPGSGLPPMGFLLNGIRIASCHHKRGQ